MAKTDSTPTPPNAPAAAPAPSKGDLAVARLADKLRGVKAGPDEHPADVAIRVIDDLARSNKSMLGDLESAKENLAAANERASKIEKALADARASGKASGPVKTRFLKP